LATAVNGDNYPVLPAVNLAAQQAIAVNQCPHVIKAPAFKVPPKPPCKACGLDWLESAGQPLGQFRLLYGHRSAAQGHHRLLKAFRVSGAELLHYQLGLAE